MNDFFYMLIGIMVMMTSLITGILVSFNMIPPMIYIVLSILVGVASGVILMLYSLLLRGVLAPMLSARVRGKTLNACLTASKNIELLTGYEDNGIQDTDRGGFLTPVNTVYLWPNGVRGGFSLYKYGVTLDPKIVKACSVFRKNNIKDINMLEEAEKEANKHGKSIDVDLNEGV